MEWSEAPVRGVEGRTRRAPLVVAAGEPSAGDSDCVFFL